MTIDYNIPSPDTDLHDWAVIWHNSANDADNARRWKNRNHDINPVDEQLLTAKSHALRTASKLVIDGTTRSDVVAYAHANIADAHLNDPGPARTATIAAWSKVIKELEIEPRRLANAAGRRVNEPMTFDRRPRLIARLLGAK